MNIVTAKFHETHTLFPFLSEIYRISSEKRVHSYGEFEQRALKSVSKTPISRRPDFFYSSEQKTCHLVRL